MNNVDTQYNALVVDIDRNGNVKCDRTGVGSKSVFGRQMRFDISDGKLPLLTTKKVYTRAIIHELIWMLSGDTNIRYLKEHGVNIWDSWIDPTTAEYDDDNRLVAGDCPKVYGKQWRYWEDMRSVSQEEVHQRKDQGFTVIGVLPSNDFVIHRQIDQIAKLVDQLKTNPDSRRHILTAWNPAEVDEMALPPCHGPAQFWTRELTFEERQTKAHEKGYLIHPDPQGGIDNATLVLDTLGVPRRVLSCMLTMRSNDVPLGQPFNLVQYAILTHLLAHVTGMGTDELIWSGGDTHVYQNQWGALKEQLEREPLSDNGARVVLNPNLNNIDDFTFDDIKIEGYVSDPPVKFPAPAV